MKAGWEFATIDGIECKKCTKCLEFRALDEYSMRSGRKSPYRYCKTCQRAISTTYREENKWKMDILWKNYRIIHRDEIREKNRIRAQVFRAERREEYIEQKNRYCSSDKCRTMKRRNYHRWYEIGDTVTYRWDKWKIVGKSTHWHQISRHWLPPITVPRRLITAIKPRNLLSYAT